MYFIDIILIIVREEQLAFESLQSFPNDYGSGGTLEISDFFEGKLPCNCYMFFPRLKVVTSWSLHGNTECVINEIKLSHKFCVHLLRKCCFLPNFERSCFSNETSGCHPQTEAPSDDEYSTSVAFQCPSLRMGKWSLIQLIRFIGIPSRQLKIFHLWKKEHHRLNKCFQGG